MKIKVLLALLLIFSITVAPVNVFAVQNTKKQAFTISIYDAYNRALNVSYDLEKNDRNIYELLKPFGATKIVHSRDQYNMENEFKRLYQKLKSGNFIQSYEQGELVMYYAAFKDTEIFKDKSLSPTILPYDFPNCETWVKMMQMKINNEKLRNNIIETVRQLYDNLISINDNIRIMVESNAAYELEFKEANQNFLNGKISEIDKIKIVNNYNIQKLELNKQIRTKQNIERNLKKVLGIELNDEIEIIPYKVLDIVMPSYDSCINRALLNRHEIALAKMNLIATQNQLSILDNYIGYLPKDEGLKMSKQETLSSIDELLDEIKVQEEYVIKNIDTAYAEVDYQQKTLEIEKLNLQSAQKEFEKGNKQYKSGGVSYKQLLNFRIEYEKRKASYDRVLRGLHAKINELNSSCGVG